jgi:pantoate--beta-alanine ligase
MILFKKEHQLQYYLNTLRLNKKSIGLIPTMGALHEGHLSLIRKAKEENDFVVCSVFVNPTQFNNDADLEKYPRTEANDIELLTSIGTDIIFMPSVEEVYPKELNTTLELDFGELATTMEGEFRPGHFDGMAQVVNRFLNMVQPHSLYMGQKDFQQITIVRNMLIQLGSEVRLVMCPILRQDNGLAMSSRNVRLTPENRALAVKVFQTLSAAKNLIDKKTPKEIEEWAMQELNISKFRPEYFSIVDGITLQLIEDFGKTNSAVACTAVWAGDVRLIDNMILKS